MSLFYKRESVICSKKRANHTFAHKKHTIRTKKPMSELPTLPVSEYTSSACLPAEEVSYCTQPVLEDARTRSACP